MKIMPKSIGALDFYSNSIGALSIEYAATGTSIGAYQKGYENEVGFDIGAYQNLFTAPSTYTYNVTLTLNNNVSLLDSRFKIVQEEVGYTVEIVNINSKVVETLKELSLHTDIVEYILRNKTSISQILVDLVLQDITNREYPIFANLNLSSNISIETLGVLSELSFDQEIPIDRILFAAAENRTLTTVKEN